MRLGLPDFFPRSQVPDLDDTVSTARGESLERIGVLGHGVDSVDVAATQLGEEGLGKHAVHLCGIQGSGVFAGALEGVQCWVQVASLALDRRARRLLLRRSASEGLDFLRRVACQSRVSMGELQKKIKHTMMKTAQSSPFKPESSSRSKKLVARCCRTQKIYPTLLAGRLSHVKDRVTLSSSFSKASRPSCDSITHTHPFAPTTAMSSVRPMTPADLLKFNPCNLDHLTETYNIGFYLDYFSKWPELCMVIEAPHGEIEGYSQYLALLLSLSCYKLTHIKQSSAN
jgi:hypothetical protein